MALVSVHNTMKICRFPYYNRNTNKSEMCFLLYSYFYLSAKYIIFSTVAVVVVVVVVLLKIVPQDCI